MTPRAEQRPDESAASFTGFPTEALDFYDDLEMDNTKTFWTAHKNVYERVGEGSDDRPDDRPRTGVRRGQLFRPYRDVRFAKDKTPYKTHQGAYVADGPSTGWYVQVSAPGVRVGFGFYDASSERLGRIRDAIVDDRTGARAREAARRASDGVAGSSAARPSAHAARVRRRPPAHELLRHKSITLGKDYGFEPFIHTAELLTRVRKDWRAGQALPGLDPAVRRLTGHPLIEPSPLIELVERSARPPVDRARPRGCAPSSWRDGGSAQEGCQVGGHDLQ